VQVIEQSAPTNQTATATAAAATQPGTASSSSSQTNSHDVTQNAEQSQAGGGSQVQLVDQSAGGDRIGAGRTRDSGSGGGWMLATSAGTLSESALARWDPANPAGSAGSRPAPARRHSAPQAPQLPFPPQAPVTLGAAAGGMGSGSLWVFATFLIPFLLTAPWWARRQRPSAVRRLMGVVSRLERPG
jgi:hypothetical protein